MGDTGSLALGRAAWRDCRSHEARNRAAIIGGIFVMEALSVMIQVTSSS
jgi:UDP-N-acetylmuramyl pentapeptide phosphotransferase/UDP-N-acetylglucosamine-1-phosphate transferase